MRTPEVLHNSPHVPDTFGRLVQATEARAEQLAAAEAVFAARTDLQEPQPETSGAFSLVTNSGRLAAPVLALYLAVLGASAVACGDKEPSTEPTATQELKATATPENFADQLPQEIIDACRAYIEADFDNSFLIAAGFSEEHPSDARGMYMKSISSILLAEFESARSGLETAINMGLPDEQEGLAQNMIEALGNITNEMDAEEVMNVISGSLMGMYRDFRDNVCPEKENGPSGGWQKNPDNAGGEDKESTIQSEFVNGLPNELVQACHSLVDSDIYNSDTGDIDLSLALSFLTKFAEKYEDNPGDADPRGMYLMGVYLLFDYENLEELGVARSGFSVAIEFGLPEEQKVLASSAVESIDAYLIDKSAKSSLDDSMVDIYEDLRTSACP